MQTFQSGSAELAFLDEGEGEPIILIHGFASNIATNWVNTGWVDFLKLGGYRVIAIDNRGHGQSQKLYDVEDYSAPIMADDVRNLMDHLSIDKAYVMGYSMGARITAFFLMQHEERVAAAIIAGMGLNLIRGMGAPGPIAQALEAPTLDDVKHPTAKTFREFAERTKSDLRALSACIRSARDKVTSEDLQKIDTPVLIAVGTNDVIAGSPEPLGEAISGSEVFNIENRDHMSAVGDPQYKQAVLDFLKAHPIDN